MIKVRRKKYLKDFKKAIVRYIKDNKKKLAKDFVPRREEGYLDKALIDKNWVRVGKYLPISYNYEIVNEFDCRPYNGELRAYVYTTRDEFEIENVIVQTE
jgi:hypothetical protein